MLDNFVRLAGDVKQQLINIMLDPNAEDFETANQMINGLKVKVRDSGCKHTLFRPFFNCRPITIFNHE